MICKLPPLHQKGKLSRWEIKWLIQRCIGVVNATCSDASLNKLCTMVQLPWEGKIMYSKSFYSPEHITHCFVQSRYITHSGKIGTKKASR